MPHPDAVPFLPVKKSPAEALARWAQVAAEHDAEWDFYGDGGLVATLEGKVAELLGKPAAALFPSGIMAQQCALRVWTDRRGSKRVALPDLSHLVVHEEDGPRLLHGFEFVHLTTGPEVATAAHVEKLPGRIGAVLVELPLRDGAYLLPTWGELAGLATACRERETPLHLDGARLWESADQLGHSLAEIAELADTVYVSLYKGLGGPNGALLAGDEDVIAEAKLWRRRMGGTFYSLAAEAAAALAGLDEALPAMPDVHRFAVELARALQDAGFRTEPEVPHTNAFRLFVPLAADDATARLKEYQERTGARLLGGMRPTPVPGWAMTEVTVVPGSLGLEPVRVARAIADTLG